MGDGFFGEGVEEVMAGVGGLLAAGAEAVEPGHEGGEFGEDGESFEQHREGLAGDVEVGGELHEGDDLGDDGVVVGGDAPAEADDGDDRGGVALEVLDVGGWFVEEVEGNDFGLVVLDGAVATDGLGAHAQVHQLPVDAPLVAFGGVADLHGYEVGLAGAELAEDDHAWPRGIDLRFFLKDLVCGPGVVDPDGRVSGTCQWWK